MENLVSYGDKIVADEEITDDDKIAMS